MDLDKLIKDVREHAERTGRPPYCVMRDVTKNAYSWDALLRRNERMKELASALRKRMAEDKRLQRKAATND
jgi:hypothetical protein